MHMEEGINKLKDYVMNELAITRDKEVVGLMPKENTVSYLTDALTGIFHSDSNSNEREEALKTKYEIAD